MATPPWVLLCRAVSEEVVAGAAAGAPDFTLPVPPPPGVAILAAGRGAHPDPDRPDACPGIIAAAPDCLLAHFGVAPSIGLYFSDNPSGTHLVMARHFRRAADGRITASAERIPDRPVHPDVAPVDLSNIFSVGFVPNADGSFTIAELQVRTGSDHARLSSFHSGTEEWYDEDVESPVPAADRDRKWEPHGAVVLETTVWWFDLSWGVISCDIEGDFDALLFHPLPPGRALPAATPTTLDHRCITVSQGDLRYVEIIREAGAAAAVHMWSMVFGQGGWAWAKSYSVSFEEIWNDDSYRETGLPRRLPMLAAMCPSDPLLVYFAMNKRIFGVNMHGRRVLHEGPYNLVVNNATLAPEAPACRFLLPWQLPPAVTAVPLGSRSSISTRQLRLQFNSLLTKGRRPKSPPYIQPEGYSLPSLASLDLPDFLMNPEMGNAATPTTSSSSSSSSSSDDQLDDFEEISAFGNIVGLATDQEEEELMMEASVLVGDDPEATEIILIHDCQLGEGIHGASRDFLLEQRIVFFGKEKDITSCRVCISEFHTKDRCIWLPCKHMFHVQCILQWLLAKDTCPVCRRAVSSEHVHSTGASETALAISPAPEDGDLEQEAED